MGGGGWVGMQAAPLSDVGLIYHNGVLGLTATVGLNQLIHHMGLVDAAPDSGQAFLPPPPLRRSVTVVVLSC